MKPSRKHACAMLLLGALASTAGVLATGCGESIEFESKHRRTQQQQSSSTLPLIERLAAAPDTTRFQGVRRYEAHYVEQGQPKTLIYRERVSCDGMGNFSLELLDVLAPTSGLDHGLFLLLHDVRAGFVHRYRDLRIHHLATFLENYTVLDAGVTTSVAGRECASLELRRNSGAERVWRVAVDLQTGLPLSVREESLTGELLTLSEHESLDLAPDLSSVDFHTPINSELPLPSDAAAAAGLLGFAPHLPRVLPEGWRQIDSSVVRDPVEDRAWMKLTLTDGLETLLYLHGGAEPALQLASSAVTGDFTRGGSLGAWNVLQARVDGQSYLCLGRRPVTFLQTLVQSALP